MSMLVIIHPIHPGFFPCACQEADVQTICTYVHRTSCISVHFTSRRMRPCSLQALSSTSAAFSRGIDCRGWYSAQVFRISLDGWDMHIYVVCMYSTIHKPVFVIGGDRWIWPLDHPAGSEPHDLHNSSSLFLLKRPPLWWLCVRLQHCTASR